MWDHLLLHCNSIYAKKHRNGPSRANQVISGDKPRHVHAVCTLWMHPPTSPCPMLSAEAEPISKGHCWKWHHEAESLLTLTYSVGTMGPKELRLSTTWVTAGDLYNPKLKPAAGHEEGASERGCYKKNFLSYRGYLFCKRKILKTTRKGIKMTRCCKQPHKMFLWL